MARPTEGILRRLAAGTAGIGRVRRPASPTAPAFDLTYVRRGPRGAVPVVVVPGGPGLASVLPYRGFRAQAARRGLDVVMVEHRGVGLSRTGLDGRVLPPSAMRISAVLDDIAAVLDHERIPSAYLVGSSYGSYLAAAFSARYPDRVTGMLLDSALQSTQDLALERRTIRALFWESDEPEAQAIRHLIAQGADERRLLGVVRAAYELGGTAVLCELLAHRLRHRRGAVWAALDAYAGRGEAIAHVPYVYEFDAVGTIAFRELHYGAPPDGLPLDPALTYQPLVDRFPAFAGEPFDLPALTAGFDGPMVLLAGDRDLRTPAAIAERTAAAARDAMLVTIANGHSALETHPLALLHATCRLIGGEQRRLPGEAAVLDGMPRRSLTARAPELLSAGLRLERLLRR